MLENINRNGHFNQKDYRVITLMKKQTNDFQIFTLLQILFTKKIGTDKFSTDFNLPKPNLFRWYIKVLE